MANRFGFIKSTIKCCHNYSPVRCKSTQIKTHWTSEKIRKTFIDFFVKEKGHQFVKSSSIIPQNDNTLVTVNSGMNQFKPVFLGTLPSDHEFLSLRRVVNSQKCIRCGGKHNDLDHVGHDLRHHTFFEMLGNWSFGDYYKHEAIKWSWELLVDWYQLDPERIFVTYFGGDETIGVGEDRETRDIWSSMDMPRHKIIPLGSGDNFWEMSSTGPCGPCTEIHYLLEPLSDVAFKKLSPEQLMNCSIEIWNLVFMQYNRLSASQLQPLPLKHVDTGMGLERLTSLLQTEEKNSNYDTDLFIPLFNHIEKVTKCKPYGGSLEDPLDISYRIVADHSRMISVSIADGLYPSTRGAGHKLRRIIRSAGWRCIHNFHQESPYELMLSLPEIVGQTIGSAYPEIPEKMILIKETIESELDRFLEHIHKTKIHMDYIMGKIKKRKHQTMSREEIFNIVKLHGTPLEFLQDFADRNGFKLDLDGFHQMKRAEIKRSLEMGGTIFNKKLDEQQS